jgi:hypothetical protein
MRKGYLLSLNKGTNSRYLTMINQRGQSRIMCFENSKDAQRCKDYVVHFKTAYGKWPSMDMSETVHKIDYQSEKLLEANINNQLEIKYMDNDTFNYYCGHKKMSFLMCKSFNTFYEKNKHTLDFTGEEYICNSSENMYDNVTNLNTLYEKF